MHSVAIDLFCGIGGLTKGLSLSGIPVKFGIDIDDTCRFAYEKNNNSRFLCYDIATLDSGYLKSLYPPNCIRILVSHFQSTRVAIEKMVTQITNGCFCAHFRG